jgi:hypothetical protein
MDDKRKRFKEYWSKVDASEAGWDEYGYSDFPPEVPFPEDLKGMTCGARTKRTGLPCKQKAIYKNSRCIHHGGLSTGPRTVAGKEKSAQNGFKKGWSKQASLAT